MEIALNTYSLRKEWFILTSMGMDPIYEILEMLDIKEIELYDGSYQKDPEKLNDIKKKLEEKGYHIFSLGEHPHLLTNPENFESAIKEGKECIDLCTEHGVKNFRVAIGGGKYEPEDKKPESLDQAVEWGLKVMKPVTEYAEEKGITLCLETHHNYSSNPEWQSKILEEIQSDNFGFIFDIGNYENDTLRWDSLEVLIEKNGLKYMHAKAYKFDEKGFETTLDYPRAIKMMKENGYDDIKLSIEWEGNLGGLLGALKTNELLKYSIAEANGEVYTMKTNFPNEDEMMDEILADPDEY